MSKGLLKAILRSDFTAFVQKVFLEVSPNAHYLDNWHIDLICHELEALLAGKNPRLIVNIPPRYIEVHYLFHCVSCVYFRKKSESHNYSRQL